MSERADAGREWFVYILECSPHGSLYTGRTTDLNRRFMEHVTGVGAKYTRAHMPRRIAWWEGGHTSSSSGKREAAIKRLTRAQKIALVNSSQDGS
jgi:putative endonuclease